MELHIFDNYLQRTCFAVAVVGVTLAILATALRFIATKRSARKPSWEDCFAVLATLFYILYVVPFFYYKIYCPFRLWPRPGLLACPYLSRGTRMWPAATIPTQGFMSVEISLKFAKASPVLRLLNGRDVMDLGANELVALTKTGYVMAAQFCPQQTFTKLSLVALYYRIFTRNKTFIYCLYAVGVVQLAWGIGTFIAHWTECTPAKKLWSPTVPGICENAVAFLVIGETVNSLLDFTLVGLAIWIVQSLQMKRAVKMKLSVIFALGGLAGILGFVKTGFGFAQMSENAIALYDPQWATIQQGCSVVCCCAPIYKPLIPKIPTLGLYGRLKSFSSRVFRRKNSSNSEIDVAKLPLDSLLVDSSSWEQGMKQSDYHQGPTTQERSAHHGNGHYNGVREEV